MLGGSINSSDDHDCNHVWIPVLTYAAIFINIMLVILTCAS